MPYLKPTLCIVLSCFVLLEGLFLIGILIGKGSLKIKEKSEQFQNCSLFFLFNLVLKTRLNNCQKYDILFRNG